MAKFTHQLDTEYVYDDMVLSTKMQNRETLDKVKEFDDYSSDVLIATYPKTGTTWSQEMLWLLRNNADLEEAKRVPLPARFPFIEFKFASPPYELERIQTGSWPHPRTIKTHLPARYFPNAIRDPNCKIVVVVRNPKDTLVSLYHFYRAVPALGSFTGTWNEFFALVEAKHMYYGDFFEWYMDWWQYKDQPNVFFLKYEDMKKDLRKQVHNIAAYLGESYEEPILDKIIEHLQFKTMKTNKMLNYEDSNGLVDASVSPFMRKGEVGDWKNYFTKEQSDYVDERYKETLEKAGLVLEFELIE